MSSPAVGGLAAIRRAFNELQRRIAAACASGPGGALDAEELGAGLLALKQRVTEAITASEGAARLGQLALDLARLFGESSAPSAFSAAALRAVAPVLEASTSHVVLFDRDGLEATLLASLSSPPPASSAPGGDTPPAQPSRSILNQVREHGSSVLLQDALEAHGEQTSIEARSLRSVLATPLVLGGRVTGAIYVENVARARAFTTVDQALLESIAELLSPYLQAGQHLASEAAARERLEATLHGTTSAMDFVGESPAMRKVMDTVARLSDSDVPVLVRGESGTGKELVARALHYSGRRAHKPLVTVNCAAIPEGLMESELFGHERGAFTGATELRRGRFEQACGGTLFLDEIGELRYDLQAKLLRVLQEQTFERVGGSRALQVDVRLVAATNRDLDALIAEGRFRDDLYYRIAVVPILLPPLRQRPEDIRPLVARFVTEFGETTGRHVTLDPAVVTALERYPFPGNVRELRNVVYRLVALATRDTVTAADLPEHITGTRTLSLDKDPLRHFLRRVPETNDELKATRAEMEDILRGYLREIDAAYVRQALERAGGNVTEAARLAGMNRTQFHRLLAEVPDRK